MGFDRVVVVRQTLDLFWFFRDWGDTVTMENVLIQLRMYSIRRATTAGARQRNALTGA
jgi:hypothetical protein